MCGWEAVGCMIERGGKCIYENKGWRDTQA